MAATHHSNTLGPQCPWVSTGLEHFLCYTWPPCNQLQEVAKTVWPFSSQVAGAMRSSLDTPNFTPVPYFECVKPGKGATLESNYLRCKDIYGENHYSFLETLD